MIEGDIFKIEDAEHPVRHHEGPAHEAHAGGIAPHAPEDEHGSDEHRHHEARIESNETNGGNHEN